MRELTRAEMSAAVRRMQDHIGAHLHEAITATDLARVAGYSAWYAQRIFRELIGQPPFEYIRRFRLSKAALVLRDEPARVLDVALDFMFDSHEGFTRSFSKEFGLTPSQYRREPRPIKLFRPYPLVPYRQYDTGDAAMNGNTTQTIFVQVIERPARKVLLKRGSTARDYFAYCGEVGCEVWGVLCSVKEALYEPAGFWLPEKLRPAGTSAYVQGVELPGDWSGLVPEGFELAEFGPAKLMVFQGEPYDDDNFSAAIDAVVAKIDRFNPALYGFEWAPDSAARFQLEPQGWRGYIEARPVRSLKGE